MEERGIRWTRVIHLGDDASGDRRHGFGHALIVTPPELARGIASLIKVSEEYRDVGLLVTNVGPRSQATAAGIERGDVLLRYNGVPLETADRLTSLEGVAAQHETPQLALEAVRGAREMTFTVPAGRLGITVSPLLHRLDSSRRAMTGVIRALEGDENDERAEAGQPTLVEVPSELVRQVSRLVEVLQRPSNAKQRKKVEALLVTAARMG
jgi:hypothetical protein